MAVKKTTDDFNFATARGSSGRTAFRTPQMSRTQFTPVDRFSQKVIQNYVASGGRGLQSGVSPYKMLYGALTSAANRAMMNPLGRGNIMAANTLRGMADDALLAQRFPKSAGASKIQDFFMKMGTEKMLQSQIGGGLKGPNLTFGSDADAFRLSPQELQVVNRAGAKIVGNAARGEPSLRPMARGFGVGSQGQVSKSALFRDMDEGIASVFDRIARGLPAYGKESYGPYSVRAEPNGSMWRTTTLSTPAGTRIRVGGPGRYWEEVAARTRLTKTLEELKALKARINPDGSMRPPAPRTPTKRGRL